MTTSIAAPLADDADLDGFDDNAPTQHASPNTDHTVDNCPGIANADQTNTDGNRIDLPGKSFDDMSRPNSDALGDACDPDDDNDGRSDADESGGIGCGGAITDPLRSDTDGDNALDGAECAIGTDPLSTASQPSASQCGALAGTNSSTHSDADGIFDYREVCYLNTNPLDVNTDGDGCGDKRENASVNANNAVDVIDLQQVASEVGSYTYPASPVKADYDIRKDRGATIDVIDLQGVAAAIGLCP